MLYHVVQQKRSNDAVQLRLTERLAPLTPLPATYGAFGCLYELAWLVFGEPGSL